MKIRVKSIVKLDGQGVGAEKSLMWKRESDLARAVYLARKITEMNK